MGHIVYEHSSAYYVEDALLSHLRLVLVYKLRRQESFSLGLPHEDLGTVRLWISPAEPLVLRFYGSRDFKIDRAPVHDMMRQANDPNGLVLGKSGR